MIMISDKEYERLLKKSMKVARIERSRMTREETHAVLSHVLIGAGLITTIITRLF